MRLSHDGRILVTLLIAFVICGILLSPLGFETRASAFLSSPASLPWLGLAFGGLILNLGSLVLAFFKARTASMLATLGSIASVALFVADQAGLAISIRPPPAITALEAVTTAVAGAIIFVASRVYRETALVVR
jgi:hypothetical protein